jgi:hypothetical protein
VRAVSAVRRDASVGVPGVGEGRLGRNEDVSDDCALRRSFDPSVWGAPRVVCDARAGVVVRGSGARGVVVVLILLRVRTGKGGGR